MADDKKETRDRVRELVKHILDTVPTEGETPKSTSGHVPEHVVVNSLQGKIGREFDRDESSKMLITEDDLRGLAPGDKLRVADGAKFTPLASDLIREKGIELVKKQARKGELKARTVAIGADHGGFPVKEQLKDYLKGIGVQVQDKGTNSTDAVDYPDFAHAVALAVGNRQADAGIIIDGAGIGSAMTANKVPGVRAAACYSVALAKNSREHNGANVLTLGSGQNSFAEIREIVSAWLLSELTEDRHKKRVGKIDEIENRYKK